METNKQGSLPSALVMIAKILSSASIDRIGIIGQ